MVSCPLRVDRDHVGAAAVGQRHLADREHVGAEEQPRHPARDVLRGHRRVGEAGESNSGMARHARKTRMKRERMEKRQR